VKSHKSFENEFKVLDASAGGVLGKKTGLRSRSLFESVVKIEKVLRKKGMERSAMRAKIGARREIETLGTKQHIGVE